MNVVSLTGNDTLVLAGRNITDVADADWATITFENDLAAVKRGKSGNVIYAENSLGLMGAMELRVIRGSDDDKFLDSLLREQLIDFAGFRLIDGEFTKRVGDGYGNITPDTGQLQGGVFARNVDSKSNAEGDTDQSVSVYRMTFGEVTRALF